MSRPDRQRKPAKKPDPNTRFNPMTGRREPIPKPKVGKNPLDVPQFPTNLPGPRDPRQPLFPGSKRPEPPLLPSDFPDPPKPLPKTPDFVKQMEEQRKQVEKILQCVTRRTAAEAVVVDAVWCSKILQIFVHT